MIAYSGDARRTWADDKLAALKADWPRWQIWYVPRAVAKGEVWCARPLAAGDDATRTINADSPDELVQMMEDTVTP